MANIELYEQESEYFKDYYPDDFYSDEDGYIDDDCKCDVSEELTLCLIECLSFIQSCNNMTVYKIQKYVNNYLAERNFNVYCKFEVMKFIDIPIPNQSVKMVAVTELRVSFYMNSISFTEPITYPNQSYTITFDYNDGIVAFKDDVLKVI